MRILYLTANPQWVRLKSPPQPEVALKVTADPSEREAKETQKESRVAKLRKNFRKYKKLELWEELREVTDVLFDARGEGRVQFEVVPEIDRNDVIRYVASRRPNVLHFSGHGEEGQLVLNNAYDKAGEQVSDDWISGALDGKEIDVLLLNCCWSSSIAEQLQKEIPLTIGTTKEVGLDEAAEFARRFYDALQQGETLERAYDVASAGYGDLYECFHKSDDILQKCLAPTEDQLEADTPKSMPMDVEIQDEELTTEQILIGKQMEVARIQRELWFSGVWDLSIVFTAFLIASIGYMLLHGAYNDIFQAIAERLEGIPVFGRSHGLFEALARVSSLKDEVPWLEWEPWSVMVALSSVPAARLATLAWLLPGSYEAKRAIEVAGSMTAEDQRRELQSERIDLIIERLKGEQA